MLTVVCAQPMMHTYIKIDPAETLKGIQNFVSPGWWTEKRTDYLLIVDRLVHGASCSPHPPLPSFYAGSTLAFPTSGKPAPPSLRPHATP